MNRYHYTECGLNNVFISGLKVMVDDDGDDVVEIPFINGLHREIAVGIVGHENGISGAELRFLRSEMGLTQAELSKIVHCDKQTIGGWVRSETEIDGASEAIVRKMAIERLELDVSDSIDELALKSVPPAKEQTIAIGASDDGYFVEKNAA